MDATPSHATARVLDLDLDFFLDRVSMRLPNGVRLGDQSYRTWPEPSARALLESRLRLGTDRRPPGFFVTHHHEAFSLWRALIDALRICPPFAVTHVDAHADLGTSNDGHRYLMGDVLHHPPAERTSPDARKLRPGNYLLFGAACRWFSAVTYVVHHRRYRAGALWHDDRPRCHFRAGDPDSGRLELRCCDPHTLTFAPPALAGYGVSETPPLALEPAIPFETVPWWHYRAAEPFDMVIVARSPDYTPPAADALLDVIASYLDVQ